MLNKLWVRLLAAFLLVAGLAVGAVALIVRGATETSFRQYVNQSSAQPNPALLAALEAHYAESGTWAGSEALLAPERGGAGRGPGGGSGRGAQWVVADASGMVVAATDPALLGTTIDMGSATPLQAGGTPVGWLARVTPGQTLLGEAETRFLADAASWLALAALAAALLAVIASLVLARELARPLHALADAARSLAAGALGRQVEARGAAEVVALAAAFNRMSRDLAESEALRRRMAADVAHELRTPVSVLRGHLEAMLDGVFPADSAHLAVTYDQALHLARLVDDLRLLTLAEAGKLPLELIPTAPEEVAAQAVERFTPLALDAGVALNLDAAPALPAVPVDVDRIQQVLGNLLANALRHTPAGGTITVRVTSPGEAVRFAVSNTGEALTPAQAAHVFDRFWRADDARARDEGGSGLGLAITQQLVALHGGRVWVESTPGLTTFVVELPAAAPSAPPAGAP